MKKKLFLGLAALAAVALTSCQKDTVLHQVATDQPIEFGTYVGRDAQTKASVINEDALQLQGFGVFAYNTNGTFTDDATPNFMYNQKVTFSTSWTYEPVKYWPNNESKVSFFAYAPHDTNEQTGGDETEDVLDLTANSATGVPAITYFVKEDVTTHKDVLWAEPVMDKTKQNTTENITFAFKHTLSRVGFKVEAVIDEVTGQENGDDDEDNQSKETALGTTISVQEVELIAVNSTEKFFTSGTLRLNDGAWENGDRNTTSYKLTETNFGDVKNNVTNSPTQLNNENSYLMILPVNMTTAKIKVKVKYTVTTTDNKLSGSKSAVENEITSDAFGFNFKRGEAYNFVLHLGLTSVKLTATVSPWDTVDGKDIVVNVPNN